MKEKALSKTMIPILLASIFLSAFDTGVVNAEGTIYIRSDGSVDPPSAPIIRSGSVYTFTANIYEPIVLERDNIIVNGSGFKLQGIPPSNGFTISSRSNVTVKRTYIMGFRYGIYVKTSTNIAIDGNALTNNELGGVWLESSTGTNVTNSAFAYNYVGVLLSWSNSTNTISSNSIRNSPFGIMLIVSGNNTIRDNTVANCTLGGIHLDRANGTWIYHNNLIENAPQVVSSDAINTWDDDYPSGGNYWSDYAGADANEDGIGDTPYTIDGNNVDRYPLMSLRGTHDVAVTSVELSKTVIGQGYSATITVVTQNQGSLVQVFNVTVPANTSIIQTNTVFLTGGDSKTLVITWSTTGWTKGTYIIRAQAASVPGEADLADNTFTYGVVKVTVPGDSDGDRDVDIYDIVRIASAYGSKRGESLFTPNADIDSDGDIDIYDVVIAASRYGYSE